MKEIQPVF